MLTASEIEDFNYKKYEQDFTVDQVSIHKDADPRDYFSKLVEIKLGYVRAYGRQKKVLDIGCGSGDYLFELKDLVAGGYGIDYTDKAIAAANTQKQKLSAPNLQFTKANARKLPFQDGAFDLVFSFSALAYMPEVQEVIGEITRVLKTGGITILEMGNLSSLNTVVCRAYPEYTKPCHLRIKEMKQMLAHLQILEWHAFGLLPFWGQRPGWLKALLHPGFKKLFAAQIQGKMLDEWLSNSFLFKPWAYRHFIICRKG